MPEGEEDDRLDGEELEHGFVGPEQVAGGEEEEEEGVERQADGEVVDDADVQVSPGDTAESRETSRGVRLQIRTLLQLLNYTCGVRRECKYGVERRTC